MRYQLKSDDSVHFISDPHFWHKNILKFCPNRPFATMEEMIEGLIERWNSKVKPGGTVFVLGDFCFGGATKTRDILSRLNGYKVCILGNHDHEARKMLSYGFNEVMTEASITDSVTGHFALMSHYPYWPRPDEKLPKSEYRYESRRLKDQGSWLLHGHVHRLWKKRGRMINVGVDQWDCYPVSWGEIKALMDEGEGTYDEIA